MVHPLLMSNLAVFRTIKYYAPSPTFPDTHPRVTFAQVQNICHRIICCSNDMKGTRLSLEKWKGKLWQMYEMEERIGAVD